MQTATEYQHLRNGKQQHVVQTLAAYNGTIISRVQVMQKILMIMPGTMQTASLPTAMEM